MKNRNWYFFEVYFVILFFLFFHFFESQKQTLRAQTGALL